MTILTLVKTRGEEKFYRYEPLINVIEGRDLAGIKHHLASVKKMS